MRGVAMLASIIAGCGGGGDSVAPPSPRVVPVAPTPLPAVAPPELPIVRLRSPGAEPRRELRYRPATGSSHALATGMDMAIEMTYGGRRMFGQESPMTGKLALRVSSIDRGNITLDLEVREMKEPNFEPTQAKQSKSLAGLRGSFTMTDRGIVIAASPSIEASATRESLLLLDYTLALPAEPVGIGAEWEVDMVLLRNGITMRVVQVHKLVAFDGLTLKTVMTEKQHADSQLVTTLSEDPLTMFEVRSLSGQGSGETQVSLDKPMPSNTTSKFEFGSEMTIFSPGGDQRVAMSMRAKMRSTLD